MGGGVGVGELRHSRESPLSQEPPSQQARRLLQLQVDVPLVQRWADPQCKLGDGRRALEQEVAPGVARTVAPWTYGAAGWAHRVAGLVAVLAGALAQQQGVVQRRPPASKPSAPHASGATAAVALAAAAAAITTTATGVDELIGPARRLRGEHAARAARAAHDGSAAVSRLEAVQVARLVRRDEDERVGRPCEPRVHEGKVGLGRHLGVDGQAQGSRRLGRRPARAAEAVAGRPVLRPLPLSRWGWRRGGRVAWRRGSVAGAAWGRPEPAAPSSPREGGGAGLGQCPGSCSGHTLRHAWSHGLVGAAHVHAEDARGDPPPPPPLRARASPERRPHQGRVITKHLRRVAERGGGQCIEGSRGQCGGAVRRAPRVPRRGSGGAAARCTCCRYSPLGRSA